MSASIKQQRKAAGLSQFALAYTAKISRFRLALHEQGFLDLREDEIQKIQAVFRRKK